MLMVFGIYMATTIYSGFKNPVANQSDNKNDSAKSFIIKDIIMLMVSVALIALFFG